jgi:NAD(P)-dependent dehydrogenase (short-subunit alcohol dehydrogenase family)
MTDTPSTFAGRTAIITGGASGIGAALAAELVRLGAHVVPADIDEDALGALGERLSVTGRRLDVRDREAVQSLVDDVVARHGRLDYFFNNAGVGIGGPTHDLTAEHWDHVLDVNLRGVINGVLAAYPQMVAQGHGHLVNTASAAALITSPFMLPYAASKHAVLGLSVGLRPEAALHGVKVSALCPGPVDTPILDRLPPEDLPPRPTVAVTPRSYLAAVRQRPVPADRFARAALDGVARDRPVIVAPAGTRFTLPLLRLAPRLTERYLRHLAVKIDAELVRPVEPT